MLNAHYLALFIATISMAYISCFRETTKKNVLLIVADDLGWSDVGYVDPLIISPNLNRLARNGIILNNTYTYSLCTPSRNSIMSGVFAERTGLQHQVILPEHPIGLPLNFKLMPKYFKEHGYKTHMVGKWHLGHCNLKYTPAKRGFDTFFGFLGPEQDYFTHQTSAIFNNEVGLDYWNQTEDRLEPIFDKNGTYSMFSYTETAVKILESHDKEKPFFMYFSSQNTHSPLQVPEEYERRYSFVKDEDRRKYLGMVTLMDEAIGNLTNKLEQLGLLKNTLIFFTSDNGGGVQAGGRNYPLRGGKQTAFEGGHRVRAFVNGPGIKNGVYDGMFHSVDWVPTILSAALSQDIHIPNIDGVNQWRSIINNWPSKRTEFIYTIDPFGQTDCSPYNTDAIRYGDWKLIEGCPGNFDQWYELPEYASTNQANSPPNETLPLHGTYLFNIRQDPYERYNLAQKRPVVLKFLQGRLKHHRMRSVTPLFYPDLPASNNSYPSNWNGTWSPGWC